MKARARRPPADHRPAGHRPRRRAHPPRTVSAAGSSSTPWPARAPPRTTHRPRIGDRASAAPPGSAATGSRADEIADIDTELRAPTARAAPTMLATKALRRQPPPPCSPAPATTPAESAPRPPSPPCAAPPRSPPAPGGPTATDSTAAATDRPTGSRTPTPRPPGDPRTKARAARLTATGKNCKETLRRPRTRHRPRSTAPADPPPTRTPHRRPAPRAPRTRTHPHPSRPPPGHPPGPDQRTRTRHTPRHHPHRSIPPMAQHPTTTDPHRLTPIGASRPRTGPPRPDPMRPMRFSIPVLRCGAGPPLAAAAEQGRGMAPREDRSGARPASAL